MVRPKCCVHGLGDVHLVRLAAGARHLRDPLDLVVAGVGHAVDVDVQLLEQLRDEPAFLSQQRVEQVLLIDLHILIPDDKLLRLAHGLQRFLRIFFSVHGIPPRKSPISFFDFL